MRILYVFQKQHLRNFKQITNNFDRYSEFKLIFWLHSAKILQNISFSVHMPWLLLARPFTSDISSFAPRQVLKPIHTNVWLMTRQSDHQRANLSLHSAVLIHQLVVESDQPAVLFHRPPLNIKGESQNQPRVLLLVQYSLQIRKNYILPFRRQGLKTVPTLYMEPERKIICKKLEVCLCYKNLVYLWVNI